MTLPPLPHALDRTVRIRAPREGVFRYFTDSSRFAAWWGAGSLIDPRPGGALVVRYPNGVEASGEVLEIDPPASIVFTYGYASGQPIPPGASRVTIRLDEEGDGTRLELRHEFAESAVRDQHVQGWRSPLAVFANVVADEAFAGAEARIDAWLSVWSEPDGAVRRAALEAIASESVAFRDRYSCVAGLADLDAHLTAVAQFFPGVRLERSGDVRHCQGEALTDWVARAADGAERGRGTNLFRFAADGRIAAVTGFWSAEGG